MDAEVQEILEDAKLVASYGARAGSFGKEEPLFTAIQRADLKGEELGWPSKELSELQLALNSAVKSILPVTLYDLKKGWKAYNSNESSRFGSFRNALVKWTVVFFAFAIMVVCATLTIWQQRASAIISDLTGDKLEQQAKAYDDLLVLVASIDENDVSNLTDPGSAVSIAFRQKQREIESVERSLWSSYKRYYEINGSYPLETLPTRIGDFAGYIGDEYEKWANVFDGGSPTGPDSVGLSDGESQASSQDSEPNVVSGCNPEFIDANLDLYYKELDPAGDDKFKYYTSANNYASTLVQKIRCETGLEAIRAASFQNLSRPGQYDIGNIQYKLNVLGLWLLPGFYGMLGAMIYHLRSFLSNVRPDPTFTTVVLRVGLSGFAGIAIGWFWLPGDGTFLGIPSITITPLTIAFLVGFGIDVFISFLDRMVTLMNRWVGDLGATN